jgi:hypothetical protein
MINFTKPNESKNTNALAQKHNLFPRENSY